MITRQTASHLIGISFLVGVGVMGLTQMAGAFASADTTATNPNNDTCTFTLQLQKSVSARMRYLVKLDQVLGKTATAGNSVEEMYGNIQPASYSGGDADTDQSGIWSALTGSAAKTTNKATGVDSFSADCIGCHDGVSASSIGIVQRNTPGQRKSQVDSFTSDHPIGMDYNAYVAARRGYKQLPSNKMVFVNGKVGCLTCHDPMNPEKGHLVMSDRNSALCTTCHDK